MSKRRNEGEWVWLPRYAGFLAASAPQRAQITSDGFEDWCPVECGDPDCREWVTLHREDGAMLCHVGECCMFDSAAEADALRTNIGTEAPDA